MSLAKSGASTNAPNSVDPHFVVKGVDTSNDSKMVVHNVDKSNDTKFVKDPPPSLGWSGIGKAITKAAEKVAQAWVKAESKGQTVESATANATAALTAERAAVEQVAKARAAAIAAVEAKNFDVAKQQVKIANKAAEVVAKQADIVKVSNSVAIYLGDKAAEGSAHGGDKEVTEARHAALEALGTEANRLEQLATDDARYAAGITSLATHPIKLPHIPSGFFF